MRQYYHSCGLVAFATHNKPNEELCSIKNWKLIDRSQKIYFMCRQLPAQVPNYNHSLKISQNSKTIFSYSGLEPGYFQFAAYRKGLSVENEMVNQLIEPLNNSA